MDTATTITAIVVGFFLLLALLIFLRLLLRKGPPHWTELRIGFFIERVPEDDAPNPLPPTTYQGPG